jgi:hypothetical protein
MRFRLLGRAGCGKASFVKLRRALVICYQLLVNC